MRCTLEMETQRRKEREEKTKNLFPLRPLCVLMFALSCLIAASASAQVDFTRASDITFGVPVSESIDGVRFFDWWRFVGRAGDIIYIRMTGVNGLAPLIGLLDAGGDIIARSNEATGDAAPNGEATLRFSLPEDGDYVIVATRVGNESGATAGDYVLQIDWLNPPPTRDPLYQDVTFECDGETVTAAVTLRLYPDAERALFVRAYGVDGVRPIIRYRYDVGGAEGCSAAPAVGDVLTLPGEPPRAISADTADTSASLAIPASVADGEVVLTIGARDSSSGRFVVLVGGLYIAQVPATTAGGAPQPPDTDELNIRRAPRAGLSSNPLSVYMVSAAAARLDPYMRLYRTETGCDDAGRRASGGQGCESMPPFVGAGVSLADGMRYIGDRFDAGMQIASGDTLPVTFQFTTFNRSTSGEYAVIVIGDLPAR